MSKEYVSKWSVPRSDGLGFWTVSLDDNGEFSCSCPVWKFKREECHHIEDIRGECAAANLSTHGNRPPAVYVLYGGRTIAYEPEANRLLIPLIPFGARGEEMEAQIIVALLLHGWTMRDIRSRRRTVGKKFTALRAFMIAMGGDSLAGWGK